ncbi:MAG: pyruvate kinase [Candidatus Omnitrophica bacterium 4484_171]|nr:MAG: pyruvate kinase [Candidatus Omnitrophica bacterium 4484_171]
MPKTKIIATLGPASNDEKTLRKMILYGLDVVRLNFSHGKHAEHLEKINSVRILNKKLKRSIKIMQDLEGFRIRIGRIKEPFILHKKDVLYLTQNEVVGEKGVVYFDYAGSLKSIKSGAFIYINDGRIILKVKKVYKKELKTEVLAGGVLKGRKGVNIPDVELDFDSLTQKDMKDIKFALRHKPDYIAQSFVRNASDIIMLKKMVKPHLPECKIIAKIESQSALRNINEIIRSSDGIMVARGDLGICVPIYHIPILQKEIVKKCRLIQKPVIVATQMLESMIEEPIPTRAEVTDVANAIFDGANFLLLSAETAIGKNPPRVIAMMNKIIKYSEQYQNVMDSFLR